jgi:hypothetical protein
VRRTCRVAALASSVFRACDSRMRARCVHAQTRRRRTAAGAARNAAVAWAASMRRTAWNVQRPHSRTRAANVVRPLRLHVAEHVSRYAACCMLHRPP